MSSEQTELALLGRYVRGRREADPDFDPGQVHQDVCDAGGATRQQNPRHFLPRLDMRDGKPQYLRHMPRVWGYLQRSLGHPALEPLECLVYRPRTPLNHNLERASLPQS